MSDRLTIKYQSIEGIVDYGLLEPAHIEDEYAIVCLNFYGSHSVVQAIFSALATWTTLNLSDGKKVFRRDSHSLCGKTKRIGYGKYHTLAYNPGISRDYIIQYPGEDEETAWVRYLAERKIPFKKEWIPALKRVLLAEGELTECFGIGGLKGWKITISDEKVCDLIVRKIYTDKKTRQEISAIAKKHGLPAEALQGFVEKTLNRMALDEEDLTALFEPLGLNWKDRAIKKLALMDDLTPLLKHLAQGKEISFLELYEKEAV